MHYFSQYFAYSRYNLHIFSVIFYFKFVLLDFWCTFFLLCLLWPLHIRIPEQIPCMWKSPDSDSNISCSDVLNLQYNLFSVSTGRVIAILQSEACRSAPPLWPERDSIGWRGSHILDGDQSQEPKRPKIERFFVVLLFAFITSSEPSDLQLPMTEANFHFEKMST